MKIYQTGRPFFVLADGDKKNTLTLYTMYKTIIKAHIWSTSHDNQEDNNLLAEW